MPDIWLSGGENPAFHALFTVEAVAKVAVNVSSLLRNYRGSFNGLQLDPGVALEWLAWTDSPDTTTLDDLLEVTQIIGEQATWAAGPEAWDSHPGYLPLWDGLTPIPVRSLPHGIMASERVFRVEPERTKLLAGKKHSSTFGVITGKSAPLDGFDIVVNTSWWNVAAMGELQVWDSRAEKLWRHNVRDRDMKAVEHEAAIKELGVSHNDILQADREALLTLSVRSWLALSDHLQAKAAKLAAPKQQSVATTGPAPLPVVPGIPGQPLATNTPAVRQMLPTLVATQRELKDANGAVVGQQTVMASTSYSLRQCDNCNLAVACPSYTPGSQCNFAMPVELKTKEQIKGMQQAMIELETQRILQGRFAEEIMGQGLDPQVGKEITRLFDLINRLNRDDPNGAFKILVQGTGAAGASAAQSGGILSQLFGGQVAANARQPAVTAPPTKELDVVDGQVVEDGDSN